VNSLELSRWQFGLTTLLHFAVVGVSIGLVLFVAVMQTRWLRTGDERWLRLTRFYGRPMLIVFAVGVVTGIIQTFQFGMNWSRYSRYVGDVFGAPLALEGLGAFFVESVFLGLWMFGWGRLPRRLHAACLWIVAGAAVLSAYAILVANSWMQHPVGYALVDGRAELIDVWPVLFNLNVGLTTAHVLCSSLLTGALVVLAAAAWHLRRGQDVDTFRPAAGMAVKVGLAAALGAATFGHFQGVLAFEQQPMKMAASEALYESEQPAGLSLFAVGAVSANPGELAVDVKLPHALSVLNDLSLDSRVQGINELQARAEAEHGPGNYVPIVGLMYWSFRVMVGGGVLLIALTAVGWWLWRRGRLHVSPRFLRLAMAAVAVPFVAQAGGWLLREGGRQPWVVYGLLRTSDANSTNVAAWAVALTFAAYLLVYGVIFVLAHRALVGELREGLPDGSADPAAPGRRSDADLALTY
jgi:cytochrome d ubiquinol oxidase subunit I